MRRTAATAALALLVLLLPTAPAQAAAKCSGQGARGLAATNSARVFSLPVGGEQRVYACIFSQNRRRLLGTLRNCSDDIAVGQFALRGRYVAYVETSCSLVSGTDWVVVRDIRTGSVKHRGYGAANPEHVPTGEPYITVLDLAVSRSGSVVWIGEYDADAGGLGGPDDRRQVRMMFEGHAQENGDVADEGFGIAPGSLAIGARNQHGFSWAYWQVGDQPRAARLPP